MPNDTEPVDVGNGAAAGSTKSNAPHDERVWTALQPELEALKGDVVCLVPHPTVKAEIKKKYEARQKSLKVLLAEKIVEVVSMASVPKAPERSVYPGRINMADLKANLADEWSESLKAIVSYAQANHKGEGFMEGLKAAHDLYERKISASFAGFEQQVLDRCQPQGAFGPLEFDRPSMEADFPFDTDAISRARTDSMSGKLSKAQLRIEQQEAHLQNLDKMLKEKASEVTELQKKLDHEQCTQRINELEAALHDAEAALEQEQRNVAGSAKTIKDLRDVVQSLREELHKHGIRQPLDFRLKQLGLTSVSDDQVGSTASALPTNRYGRNGIHAK
ncbi:hypothetical protein AAVH_10343 [Aphelenchoides avenae]|nr:hypothetical protein AAVH_10343 [Aphelenchus avenae]